MDPLHSDADPVRLRRRHFSAQQGDLVGRLGYLCGVDPCTWSPTPPAGRTALDTLLGGAEKLTPLLDQQELLRQWRRQGRQGRRGDDSMLTSLLQKEGLWAGGSVGLLFRILRKLKRTAGHDAHALKDLWRRRKAQLLGSRGICVDAFRHRLRCFCRELL